MSVPLCYPGCIEYRKVDSVLLSVEEEELEWVHCRGFLWKNNWIHDVYHNNSNDLEATFVKLSDKIQHFIAEFIDVRQPFAESYCFVTICYCFVTNSEKGVLLLMKINKH